jgi:hypothetical protein
MSNPLPELLRYQSWLFELTTSMRVQKDGFQNREGWTLLEEGGTERSDVLREYRTSQVRSRFDVESAS